MRFKVLKISDGKAGHISISDGIIEAIGKYNDIEIKELHLKLRVKLFLQIIKFILKYDLLYAKFVTSNWFMHFLYDNYSDIDSEIDFVVSAGGDTMFANIWLSKKLNAKNIFFSFSKKINPKYFTLVLSTLDELNTPNSIKLNILPAGANSNNLNIKIEEFCRQNNLNLKSKYFTLLIGGNGSGYKYKHNDYVNLVNNFMKIVKENNAKALITTSRRTGVNNEKLLKELFDKHGEDVAYSVYYDANPERIISIYLALTTAIFVTEDSGSMIAESISCKKPVFTLFPETVKKQQKYHLMIKDLSNKQVIHSLSIDNDLLHMDIRKYNFFFTKETPIDQLADTLKQYLNYRQIKEKNV